MFIFVPNEKKMANEIWKSFKNVEMSEYGIVRHAETKQVLKCTRFGYINPGGGYLLRDQLIRNLYPKGLKEGQTKQDELNESILQVSLPPNETPTKVIENKITAKRTVKKKLPNDKPKKETPNESNNAKRTAEKNSSFDGYYVINSVKYPSIDAAHKATGIRYNTIKKFCKLGMSFEPVK